MWKERDCSSINLNYFLSLTQFLFLQLKSSYDQIKTMIEIAVTSNQKDFETEVISFDQVDFIRENLSDLDLVLAWATVFCVIVTNGPVIALILKQASKTFLDKIVVLDCILCMSNAFTAINYVYIVFPVWTFFIPFVISVCNVLIILVIVIFRIVFVLLSDWVHTKRQRTIFYSILVAFLTAGTCIMAGFTIYYKDFYLGYHGMPKHFKIGLEKEVSIVYFSKNWQFWEVCLQKWQFLWT